MALMGHKSQAPLTLQETTGVFKYLETRHSQHVSAALHAALHAAGQPHLEKGYNDLEFGDAKGS
jgi:hypothetical protein